MAAPLGFEKGYDFLFKAQVDGLLGPRKDKLCLRPIGADALFVEVFRNDLFKRGICHGVNSA